MAPTDNLPSRLGWGILSCGKISSDMANALNAQGARIVAAAARRIESSKQFAESHGIPKAYGSYEELVSDAEVDVVYIGAINTEHKRLAMLALNAGKHCLVEKPLCMSSKDVRELIAYAREKGLFLMEGLWTRSFPAAQKVREILASGELGEVLLVQCDLGFDIPFEVERLYDLSQGGGGLPDLGIYPISWALLCFPGRPVDSVVAAADLHPGGADMTGVVTIKFRGGGIASAAYSTRGATQNELFITAERGRIRVTGDPSSPRAASAHVPEQVEVFRTSTSSGGNGAPETMTFPVPPPPPTMRVPYNFGKSEGFVFEVMHVEEAILAGLTEGANWTHDESILAAEIMDAARKAMGVPTLHADA